MRVSVDVLHGPHGGEKGHLVLGTLVYPLSKVAHSALAHYKISFWNVRFNPQPQNKVQINLLCNMNSQYALVIIEEVY